MKNNQKKSQQLGMPHGTANHRLRKKVLFNLINRLGLNTCHRCGESMTENDFSIDHIEDWLDSEDPQGKFFDVENITFSHLGCNVGARKSKGWTHGNKSTYNNHGCRCEACTAANTEHQRKRRAK